MSEEILKLLIPLYDSENAPKKMNNSAHLDQERLLDLCPSIRKAFEDSGHSYKEIDVQEPLFIGEV